MTFKVIWTGKEPKSALIEKIRQLKLKLDKKNEYINEILDEIKKLENKVRDRDREIYEIQKKHRQ